MVKQILSKIHRLKYGILIKCRTDKKSAGPTKYMTCRSGGPIKNGHIWHYLLYLNLPVLINPQLKPPFCISTDQCYFFRKIIILSIVSVFRLTTFAMHSSCNFAENVYKLRRILRGKFRGLRGQLPCNFAVFAENCAYCA